MGVSGHTYLDGAHLHACYQSILQGSKSEGKGIHNVKNDMHLCSQLELWRFSDTGRQMHWCCMPCAQLCALMATCSDCMFRLFQLAMMIFVSEKSCPVCLPVICTEMRHLPSTWYAQNLWTITISCSFRWMQLLWTCHLSQSHSHSDARNRCETWWSEVPSIHAWLLIVTDA